MGDFVDPSAKGAEERSGAAKENGPRTISLGAASEGIQDVTITAGSPSVEGAAPGLAGEAIAVDAVVGEINGKGVRATEFLEPMGARLVALSRDRGMTLPRWRQLAAQRIGMEIRLRVTDEVLRAEAIQSIPADQRAAIDAHIDQRWRQFVSRNGGSEELAKRTLAGEGKTYAQWRYETETSELVRYAMQKRIYPRIQVSEHDIRLYYKEHEGEYNPPPKYVMRRIAVPASRAEDVSRVEEGLARGESFEKLARERVNTYKPETGGLVEVYVRGAVSEAEFFTVPALQEAAIRAEVGRWYGPIEVAFQGQGYKEWITLERIDRRAVSFKDAQREIEEKLRERRFTEEREKLTDEMMEKANISSLESMAMRLLQIAEERYYKPEAVRGTGSGG